jgi:HAD superfamily phosphatase (TIGR01668 family)
MGKGMDKCLLLCYNPIYNYEILGGFMPLSFLPAVTTDALTDITYQWLKENGIRLLMLDFDNTIVPYTTCVPTQEMSAWLSAMAKSDITVCIVSNSHSDRVPKFCREYGLNCITHAKKPFSKGVKECLAKYGIPACQAALVGDQIFTDTLGANGCGVRAILVKAIDNHNFWLKARHVLEMPFILLAKNRRL